MLAVQRYSAHHIPLLRWAPLYRPREHLPRDLLSALVLVCIGVPEAIAFASIAGAPPESGLYALMVASITYGFLGTRAAVVVGPTSLMSLLTLASMPSRWGGAPLSPDTPAYGAVAGYLALSCGALQLLLHAARLGPLVTRFVGPPVLLGVVVVAALLVMSTQLGAVLGTPRCAGGSGGGGGCTFFEALGAALRGLPTVRPAAPLCALLSTALLLAFKVGVPRVLPPRLRGLKFLGPLALVAAAAGGAAALGEGGRASSGLALVERIPPGLPGSGGGERGGAPAPAGGDVGALLAAAVAPAVVGFLELFAIARAAAAAEAEAAGGGSRDGAVGAGAPAAGSDDGPLLAAVAAANALSGAAGGLPVTASVSRTAVALELEVATPAASLLVGLFMVPVLQWLTPVLSLLPRAAVGALIFVVVGRMLRVGEVLALARTDRGDLCVFLTVLLLALSVELLPAIAAGLAVQWALALARGAQEAPATLRLLAWVKGATGGGDEGLWELRELVVADALPRCAQGGSSSGFNPNPLLLARGAVAEWAAAGGGKRGDAPPPPPPPMPPPPPPPPPPAADVVLLHPGGLDLQFHSAELLGARLREAVACYGARALVLDARHVCAADSSGAAALLEVAASLPLRATLAVVTPAAGGAAAVVARAAAVAAAAAAGGRTPPHLPLLPSLDAAVAWAAAAAPPPCAVGGAAAGPPSAPPPPTTLAIPDSDISARRTAARRAREPLRAPPHSCEARAGAGVGLGAARRACAAVGNVWSAMGGDAPLLRLAEGGDAGRVWATAPPAPSA
jgi:SulP family sulfate permease